LLVSIASWFDLREHLFRATVEREDMEEKTMKHVSRRLGIVALLFAWSVVALPKAAWADWVITPYIGGLFGGSTSNEELPAATEDASNLTYGVSFGWFGNGIIGVEEDFAYTNKFFAPVAGIAETDLLTLMTNVIVGIPFGGQQGFGVRPFGVAGVGLMRTSVSDALTYANLANNGFGWDAGGGVDVYFWHVGIRADVRYFKDFGDADTENPLGFILNAGKLDFYRTTVGVVFRF
jgi:hypothetical protein